MSNMNPLKPQTLSLMVCPGKEPTVEPDQSGEDWEDENEPIEVDLSDDSDPSDGSDVPAPEDTYPYEPDDVWGPEGDDSDVLPEVPGSQKDILVSDSDHEDLGSSHEDSTPPKDDGVVAASTSRCSGELSFAQKILEVQKKLSQAKKELTAKNPENIQRYLNNYFCPVSCLSMIFLNDVFCRYRGRPLFKF